MTPAEYMTRLLGGAKLSTRPGPHAGGEWDAWNNLAPRVKKRIIGIGWAGPVGWAPDQLCAMLGDRWTPDELIEEMVRASRTIPEWRTQRETVSRQRLAVRHGHSSHYHHRQALARNAGHRSFWAYRRARGWGHHTKDAA